MGCRVDVQIKGAEVRKIVRNVARKFSMSGGMISRPVLEQFDTHILLPQV